MPVRGRRVLATSALLSTARCALDVLLKKPPDPALRAWPRRQDRLHYPMRSCQCGPVSEPPDDIARVLAHVRWTIGERDTVGPVAQWPRGWPDDIESALVDTVLSA
jgi:hypothetical protein